MCSRVTLRSERDRILREFGIEQLTFDYKPRYNISPTENLLVLSEREGQPRLAMLRWGLVPSWAEDPSIGNKLINARAETLAEKPSFRDAYKKRRCLILVDGFFEWQQVDRRRLPSYIHQTDDRPMSFAGLWETWNKGDEPLATCTIVTTGPNELVAPLHNRMPAIIPPEERDAWLDSDTPPEIIRSLLRPYEGGDLEAYRVSVKVNTPGYDAPDCIELAR